MTTFGSRGYMPFSKQSGNLINKKHNGTCCSVVDYGTKIFSLSTLSPMKDDLVGKKDWACEYILFSVIKIDINMTDTNIFHLNGSRFRWYQREWERGRENPHKNGEWDTPTFKYYIVYCCLISKHIPCVSHHPSIWSKQRFCRCE